MSASCLQTQVSQNRNEEIISSRFNVIHEVSILNEGNQTSPEKSRRQPVATLAHHLCHGEKDAWQSSSTDEKASINQERNIVDFHRIINLVRILCRVCIAIRRYAVSKTDSRVILDIQHFVKSSSNDNMPDLPDDNKTVYFNKALYSVESNHTFPLWARQICSQPCEERKEAQIEKLCKYLRGICTFSRFSSEAQTEICRHATYNRYDKMRIILNQGDYAEYYYILISGKVYINISSIDRNTGIEITETVDELKEHQTFGATALLHNTRRTASVVSETFVEVLLIDSETFSKYCAQQLSLQNEKVKNFLETHDVFATWSKRRLLRIANDVKTRFYRSGKIIDVDIMNSKYIYFVMDGEIDVFYCHRDDERRWLHSKKLKRNVGILGGNRIYAPDTCNLISLLEKGRAQQNVRSLIISHGATVLYIPKLRFQEVAPKNFLATHKIVSPFRNLTDVDYKCESRKAVKWLEFRSSTAKESSRF